MVRSSRRQFLRGTGVALALPWLESLKVNAAAPAAKPVESKPAAHAPAASVPVELSHGKHHLNLSVSVNGIRKDVGVELLD